MIMIIRMKEEDEEEKQKKEERRRRMTIKRKINIRSFTHLCPLIMIPTTYYRR